MSVILRRLDFAKLKVPAFLFRAGYILIVSVFVMSFLLAGFLAASDETAPVIKTVEIKGNKKISSDTIMSKLQSRAGVPFSKNLVQEDIRKLHSIGYFDDIRVEIEAFEGGVKLIYTFIEKPSIGSIDFQGNKELETKDIKEKITLTTGAVANLTLITDNAEKIILYYQSEGYWLAKVIPVISKVSDDSVALTYQITEGPKVTVGKITIEGNKDISDSDIKKVMDTKTWWLFSFVTSSGLYREDQIRSDIMKIKDLYQSRGYIYAAVSEPSVTLSADRKDLYITIYISEGEQYKVGEVKVQGNTVFSDDELHKHIKTVSGEIFNRTTLRRDIDNIVELYMDKGYARADVNPLVDVKREDKVASITLAITEGGIFRIGRIDVTGNTKTRDKVIRREMRLDEGDTFSKSLLKRSYQRVTNLNYFESVDIKPVMQAEKQLMDIDINVEEKMTGMLSIGGGYSSVDKAMIMGEITQTNLFGRGLSLKLKVDFSSRRSNYNISLHDPWFMDKPISASIGLYNDNVDYTDYDKKSMGGYLGFGKELSEYVVGNIRYKLEEVELTNISDTASSLIREQQGSTITSSIDPSVWRDTRDNYMDPTTGSKNAFYMTLAGLGGDNYFFKGLVDSSWFYPVIWDTTFNMRGRFGYATGYNDRDLPLYERYYVGGISTIRGLAFGEGGPINAEGEKIGGTKELIFNFEYIFPLMKELKVKGVLFFDYGGAFDSSHSLSLDNMRKTAGAGVRWLSPFGPLRLEWGFNLEPKKDEGDDKIEFSIGGFF